MRLDTPVAETHQLLPKFVSVPRRHPFGLLTTEPARQSVRRTIGEPAEVAFIGKAFQSRFRVRDANGVQALGCPMFVESGEVNGERRCLMIGGRVFGGRDDFASDQFGPAFQFGQNRTCGVFVVASRRDFANQSLPVAKLGRERRGLGLNPQRAIFAPPSLGLGRESRSHRLSGCTNRTAAVLDPLLDFVQVPPA